MFIATHVTVCVCYAQLKGCLLTYLLRRNVLGAKVRNFQGEGGANWHRSETPVNQLHHVLTCGTYNWDTVNNKLRYYLTKKRGKNKIQTLKHNNDFHDDNNFALLINQSEWCCQSSLFNCTQENRLPRQRGRRANVSIFASGIYGWWHVACVGHSLGDSN